MFRILFVNLFYELQITSVTLQTTFSMDDNSKEILLEIADPKVAKRQPGDNRRQKSIPEHILRLGDVSKKIPIRLNSNTIVSVTRFTSTTLAELAHKYKNRVYNLKPELLDAKFTVKPN